jgi:hypothetical protein
VAHRFEGYCVPADGAAFDELGGLRRRLRTPRAAGIAGIIFAVLLGTSLVMLVLASPSSSAQVGTWLVESSRRESLGIALALIPFAGIAFLWFLGVVRDRIGAREDRFFATVLLGSGLLFVAMLFAAAAVAGGLNADVVLRAGTASDRAVLSMARMVTGQLLNVYAMRMAAVFTLSTATIVLRTEALPRWLGWIGYAVGAVLLVGLGLSPWLELTFPAWILVASVEILRSGLAPAQAADAR